MSGGFQPGTPLEITYNFKIEPGPVTTSDWTTIGQMHAASDGVPPFFIQLSPGDYMQVTMGNGTPQNHNYRDAYIDPNPLIRDHTYSMKIDTNFAPDSSGYLYVWRDGVQIVNYHGPIGYGDATYWKEGIYRAVDAGNQTMAVDYSNLKITTPTDSYILTGTTVASSPDPVSDPIENHLPLITSNGGGATASVSVAENTTAVTKVVATNSDTGQTLAYSIVPVASGGGADASKFVIDATTGALAFKTAPNFEAPTDALAAANVYDVTVQVSDNKGGIAKQAIAVTVTDQPETPPRRRRLLLQRITCP